MLKATPAVCGEELVTLNVAAVLGETVIALVAPVIDAVTVSVAVIICVPAVFSVTPPTNVFTPLVSVEFTGSTAAPSDEVKCTVPAYPVATLLN